MAYVFDTGLPEPQRTTIRAALAARLEPLRAPSGYLQSIVQLPRLVRYYDEKSITMLRSALAGALPSVGVALGRAVYERNGVDGTETRAALKVGIYAVVAAPDLGPAPGVETILEHARELLLGQELGIAGVAELIATEDGPLLAETDFTAFHQLYTVQLDIPIHKARGAPLLTSIEGHQNESGTIGTDLDPFITTTANIPPETP
ncbi:MAG: hypothetical protein ACTHU0_22730 [Kofleriaceae bacterium]